MKVTFVVPDELMKRFRREVLERFDGKKGDLSKGITEAIELWLAKP